MALSPEEKLLVQQTKTLEEGYRANLIAGLLLRQQLQAGTVAAGDLQRHNASAALVHNAQLKIWEYFKKHGQSAPLPPLPPMFMPKGTMNIWFQPRDPKAIVGPNDYDVYLPTNITAQAFPVTAEVMKQPPLGLPVIPLVIAGITVAVSVAIIAKVALETSRDTDLAMIKLEAIRTQAQLSQYVAEARNELVTKCQASGMDARTCAEQAQKTIDSVPVDLSKIGEDKFSSNWTAWLLGGILVGAVGVVGAALYVKRKEKTL